ncbi:Uma2 family endonuclease [Paludisphaera sp.]|uniref:Uma2 family endonuclease n=1 Tax=Paludisphaera sp. TaxID=2017432 RepID=UPI00301D27D8
MSTAQPGPRSWMRDLSYIDPYEPEYPSSDGRPMAESTTQFRWIVTIKEGLDALFAAYPNVFVAGDLLWYATKGDKTDVMAPDAMVVFGRPKGDRRSYREWVEDGVVPQVVFDVASHTNTPDEMAEKRRRYDSRGVEEYYFYDPESGDFEGWLRRPDGPRPISADGWTSPRLGVTFKAPPRKEALVILDPEGRPFRTFGELAKDEKAARRIARAERRRRRVAERLTESERQLRAEADLRAESDRRLREEAERRAEADRRIREEADAHAAALRDQVERMAAMLRERGIDPS